MDVLHHFRRIAPGPATATRVPGLAQVLLTLLLVGLATGLGLSAWDLRPMHTDEAGNAASVGQALEGIPFVYDPQDRHGPVWFAVATQVARLTGADDTPSLVEWQVRLPSLLAVLGLLLTIPWWCRMLGGLGPLVAGVWWACAAPMVYYGGYAIHEPLLVLLTMLAWLTAMDGIAEQRPRARLLKALLLGGLIATALATKATTLLALGAAGAAVGLLVPIATLRSFLSQRRPEVVVLSATTLTGVFLWFSDGGRQPHLLGDLLGVLPGIGTRAAGAGHQSPWFTYADWYLSPHLRGLPWSSWILVIGFLSGSWQAWRHRHEAPHAWLLTMYVLILAGLYTLIPYKTPWLMLQVLVPGALVAGLGWVFIGHTIRRQVGLLPLLLLGTGAVTALLSETHKLVHRWPADPANPLAYAHTVPDCQRLAERLAQTSSGNGGPVAVIGADPWPLPWYLRRDPQVGYWPTLEALPPTKHFRAIVLVGEAGNQEPQLPSGWTVRIFGLRPDVLAHLYLAPASP